MPPRLELAGCRFGRWTVLSRHSKSKHGAWRWLCRCDCGATCVVLGSTMKGGSSTACKSCATTAAQTTHGMTGTVLYHRWRAMLDRTTRAAHEDFHNYGGRGIKVCDRWRSFENFSADMGAGFEPGLELDRVDVNGDYSPGNCRWATEKQQQRNKRTNHLVTWHGRTQTVQDWAEFLELVPNTVVHRLRRGWSVERALTKDASGVALLTLANGWEIPQ